MVCPLITNIISIFYLGFKGAVLALSHSPFITSSSTLPILLDEVLCLGNEEGLSQCHYRNWGLHDCSHYQDASVICQGIITV